MTASALVLLDRADALLDSPASAAAGNAARLAAVLTRQAAEELIDARCAELCNVLVVNGSWRAKLAVLKALDEAAAARVLVDSWHQLTAFCHQHAFELTPTIGEVRAQCEALRTYLSATSPAH